MSSVEKHHRLTAPQPIFTANTLDEGRISSVDVKVMVPYDTGPDQVPRAVEVERKRRMYASVDIEALLLEYGIDYSQQGVLGGPGCPPPLDPCATVSHLPLEAFDNSDFDAREPHEWVEAAMRVGFSFSFDLSLDLCHSHFLSFFLSFFLSGVVSACVRLTVSLSPCVSLHPPGQGRGGLRALQCPQDRPRGQDGPLGPRQDAQL